jgi:hypothetical protein
MPVEPTMEEKDKVEILMEEYKSLRGEILQRNTVFNNFITVSATATVTLFAFIVLHYLIFGFSLLIILASVMFGLFKLVEFDTLAAADRVREIEQEINQRAGERLLVWETDHGLYTVPYGPRGRHILRGFIEILIAARNFFYRLDRRN